jgi:sodium-type polar flagellar protein MotX
MRLFYLIILLATFLISPAVYSKKLKVVQIYTDNELLGLIKENKHLSQVVIDDCQLVQDIEARAIKAKLAAYQFLWGDMLAYGVCTKKDVPLGLHYMKLSADQGLVEGLEQLGRYYHIGKFMQVDVEQAIIYLKAAASSNHLAAQLRLADIYQAGYGSPLDYPMLYSQLHHSITLDKKMHNRVAQCLIDLAKKMPDKVVEQAKRTLY